MEARGLKGTPMITALVCRSGHVLDATAVWGRGVTPVPELEAAAIAAVMQYVFKPGKVGGQPVAAMVAVPVPFPPR
jgi:hypothetical protein